MIRTVAMRENKFVSIFSDAVLLYEAAREHESTELGSALARSSVLSVNYAIEAAANSFLQSVTLNKSLQKKIDRLSTLEKFDFVLQWHTSHCLDMGSLVVQDVSRVIKKRDSMVHPKVINKLVSVKTEIGEKGAISHTEIQPGKSKGQDTKSRLLERDPWAYTHEDAKAALKVMTAFLNMFVHCWGVDIESAESFLFQTWEGSIKARDAMFREEQVAILIRNDCFLNIEFMGIHGML